MVRRFRGRMLVSLYTFFGISSGLFNFPEQMVRFMECTENVLLGIKAIGLTIEPLETKMINCTTQNTERCIVHIYGCTARAPEISSIPIVLPATNDFQE